MTGGAQNGRPPSRRRRPHRARLDPIALLDPGSFTEIGTFIRAARVEDRPATPGDSMIGGHGRLDGRPRSPVTRERHHRERRGGLAAEA